MEHEKLLVNDKITASCQTSMSTKHHNLSNVTSKKKMTFEKNCESSKFSKNTILLQSVSVTALSIHGSFCAGCIICTFFSCLRAYFYVSPSLMVASTV